MKLQPFPVYKDSGITWLGEVPSHWELRRGKTIFEAVDIRSATGEEELLTVSSERGVIPRSTTTVTMFKAESYVGYKLCWPGDLVINSLWAWARGLGVSKHHGIVSSAYGVYRLFSAFSEYAGFIHYLVRSRPFQWELQVRSKGIWTSRLQLTDESFLTAPFPLPEPDEQAAIVRFLDYADRRINRYIRAKQKLIKLLEEQKQAIIHRTVTRGLDPTVPLKPSGVEWLGDVPEHWEIRRIRQCIESSVAGFWGDDPDDADTQNNIICVRVADFNMQSLDVSTSRLTTRSIAPGAQKTRLLQPGDLLIEKSGGGEAEPVGRAVRFSLDCRAVCSNFINRLRPDISIVRSDFLLYVLYVLQVTRRNIPSIKQTTGIQNLDERHYFRNFIGLPPLQEQEKIIEYLTRELDEIHTALDSAKHQVDLIREYRTRLIADVVTGKVDVRNVAAKLPDEIDELELVDENDTLIESENGVVDDLEETLEEAAI